MIEQVVSELGSGIRRKTRWMKTVTKTTMMIEEVDEEGVTVGTDRT